MKVYTEKLLLVFYEHVMNMQNWTVTATKALSFNLFDCFWKIENFLNTSLSLYDIQSFPESWKLLNISQIPVNDI